jgi:lipopolysaccharide export system permease protein
VPGTILFRMILWELCKVFVLSLIGITGILLMAGIIAEASQQGLGPKQILAAIPLLIPSTLPYTIPATTLFATCVVYGRLAADNEILAIKAAGVNLIHVVKPGLVLGVVMSTATLGLYYEIIPSTHRLLRTMIYHDAQELLYSMLRRDRMISAAGLPYGMFVKGVEGEKLLNPVFKRWNKDRQIDIVARAREAYLRVDMNRKLPNGDPAPGLYIHMRFGVFTTGKGDDRAVFEDKVFDVELPPTFGKPESPKARDMTWPELVEAREEKRAEIAANEAAISAAVTSILMVGPGQPADLAFHVRNLREKRKQLAQQERLLSVEMLMRPSLSIGCLCFILVGCPIGIVFSRGDYLGAFITCFLPIVIVYYPLMLCGTNMAKEGRFSQIPLVFAADAVVGLAGMFLLRTLLKN